MKVYLIVITLFFYKTAIAQQDSLLRNAQMGEPFEGIDMTWRNGSDR